MSIETLEQNIFTTASDVWSFGVVMWEIFSFGMMPYMALENDQILKHLQKVRLLKSFLVQLCLGLGPYKKGTFNFSQDIIRTPTGDF